MHTNKNRFTEFLLNLCLPVCFCGKNNYSGRPRARRGRRPARPMLKRSSMRFEGGKRSTATSPRLRANDKGAGTFEEVRTQPSVNVEIARLSRLRQPASA